MPDGMRVVFGWIVGFTRVRLQLASTDRSWHLRTAVGIYGPQLASTDRSWRLWIAVAFDRPLLINIKLQLALLLRLLTP